MKRIRTFIIGAAFLMAAGPLPAQEGGEGTHSINNGQWRNYRECFIDWMEPQKGENRYTFALRPGYLINLGLKADFEFELKKGGRWLQFEVAGRHAGWRTATDYRGNWNTVESGNGDFQKIGGFGLGIAYKQFFSANGWYFSAATTFNYYDVHHIGTRFVSFTEDGTQYYKYEKGMINTRYYKPAVNLNIGKHMAVSRHLFFDAYIGLGYAHSFFDPTNAFSLRNPYSMAYSGLIVSGGFRVGWLWGSLRPIRQAR